MSVEVREIRATHRNSRTRYMDSIGYAPHGGPSIYRYGNDLWRTLTYNNNLQWDTVND